MKQVAVGLLGFGTVGTGVYRVLTENKKSIEHRERLEINVKRILVRDLTTEPNLSMAPMELFCTNYDDIINDEEISIVVECMGGTRPAREFILRALEAGKSVVTSNK